MNLSIKLRVVSEPLDEEDDCQDIGYALVDTWWNRQEIIWIKKKIVIIYFILISGA